MSQKRFIPWLALGLGLAASPLRAAEPWQASLGQMALVTRLRELNRTNCVDILLRSLASNHIVKGIVFMPGATDEFYMFRRAKAILPSSQSLSLLDAIAALTNQTLIRASFRAPLLLLHTDEDPLDPVIHIEHQSLVAKLQQTSFVPHALYNDRDWDFLQPILKRMLNADVQPWRYRYDSWHFYRHSFAGWNLNGWEALQAVTLAGKTQVTLKRKGGLALGRKLFVFEGDERVRATPKVDSFPR